MRQAVPLSFAPDGARLLIGSNLESTQQLYALPTRGGALERLTDEDEPVSGFFLPDGRILVEIDAGGNERGQLYVLADDGGLEPLVVDPRFVHRTPHAGGNVLAYSTNRRNSRDFDIVVRRLESGEERTFELGGWCANGDISPDGRWVVAGQLSEHASGDSNLFLLGTESGEVVHATPHEGQAEYLDPVWLPDSSGFLCATNEGRDTFATTSTCRPASSPKHSRSQSASCTTSQPPPSV